MSEATAHPELGRFVADPDRSFTLPSGYYTDPAVFESERDMLLHRSWRLLGHSTELAKTGDWLADDICGQGVFAVRGADGEVNAFYNVCKHRAHELVRGRSGNVKAAITCPYHAWAYGLDGSLRRARRAEEMAGFDKGEFGLTPVRCEIFCGFVFVNLDPDAPPMAEAAPGFEDFFRAHVPDADRMVPVDRQEFPIDANWKIVVDNGLDGYHVFLSGPAHKALGKLMDGDNLDLSANRGWIRLYAEAGTPDNEAYDYSANIGQGQTDKYMTLYLWPDLFVFTMPYANTVWSMLMAPERVDHTRQEVVAYTPGGEEVDPATRDAIAYMAEKLGPEDVGLNLGVQRGLGSRGYDQGRFMVDAARSDMSEHSIHAFNRMYLEALGDLG